ncbi:MAG: 5-formyltetrahydrofolate cyclo-ligase [Bacilli bacterium]|nr:5-formyltetrahydrofolate cyclo-ligase [Bacilli bacterium]
MDSKNKLREIVKNRRKNIVDKEQKESIITYKILNNYNVLNCNNILVYISTHCEVSMINLINELFKLKKNVYVPKVIGKDMKFYKIESFDNLLKSSFGILEPINGVEYNYNLGDVVIVPGLLFDKYNNRIGYGGGYYDKFLKDKNMYKIGVCFREFYVEKIECESHDIKMDLVVTEM